MGVLITYKHKDKVEQNMKGIKIERNPYKMEYTVHISKENMDRASTSQTEYNNLITDISKVIYDYALKHNDIF